MQPSVIGTETSDESVALLKENYLSEFETEAEKSAARNNLGVYAQEAVYTQEEAELMVNEKIHYALEGYVTSDELPSAIEALSEEIASEGYVKSDGSVPFTSAQTQATLPTEDSHLANKIYVDNVMNTHLSKYDPHGTVEKVETILADYAKLSDVYTSSNLYTKKETDTLLKSYVKADGSVAFTAPQIGVDPSLPSHLSTMRYVSLVMQNHKSEEDPHGFVTTLKSYLSNYYTKSETYTKAQTYSRSQLLDIIQSQMEDVVDQAIATWEANEGSVSDLRDWVESEFKKYIKADGTVSHSAPQGGVAAESGNQFVILDQLNSTVEECCEAVETRLEKVEGNNIWVTSGPVRTTVGFVEDNTTLPSEMTLQQVCDAIFYGKTTGVCAPQYAEYGEDVCVTIHIHGTGTLEEVEIYMNGTLVGTLSPDDFTHASGDGYEGRGYEYVFCPGVPFTEDTEWEVVFHYSDGGTVTDTATTKLSYPIFVGMVPYWWNAQEDITMNSLRKLAQEDPDNCSFQTQLGPDITTITMSFDFEDSRGRSLVVVIPYDYPDLSGISTTTQSMDADDAFAKWVQPMYPNDAATGVSYKIYVYNETLYKFSQSVTLTFTTNA